MARADDSEWRTRKRLIDPKLQAAGWRVAAYDPARPFGKGGPVAIEEFPTENGPLTPAHFAEFEKCYGGDPHGAKRKASGSKEDRWRSFGIAEVKERGFKLDSFKWLKEESLEDADDLPEPEELATDAISELEAAVEELNQVLALLENGNGRQP